MMSAEPSQVSQAVAERADVVSPASTPQERQATRLMAKIETTKADIERVLRLHANNIEEAERKVSRATDDHKLALSDVDEIELSIHEMESRIEDLKTALEHSEGQIKLLNDAKVSAEAASLRAGDAASSAKAERDVRLAEPDRHTAALRRDLEKLERRLTLNRARAPLPALFVGSKDPGASASSILEELPGAPETAP